MSDRTYDVPSDEVMKLHGPPLEDLPNIWHIPTVASEQWLDDNAWFNGGDIGAQDDE
jgi:hypothetical protein